MGNSCKLANQAITVLLKELLRYKAKKERIVAKIAGGASMFPACEFVTHNVPYPF
ncbi:MAG: hypothetical protein WAV32_09600 [Halobacteriota archaeon]